MRKPFTNKSRQGKKERAPSQEINEFVKRSVLMHSAVISVRNPSKRSETLCKQLRKILSPNCLSKLEINSKLQDIIDVSSQLLLKQIIYVSENEIKIAALPNGPTYIFRIIEYEDNYKNYPNKIYTSAPFVTFDGKSSLRPIFQSFGMNEGVPKRTLHCQFKDDQISIRHYTILSEDTEDNFVVHLNEIGPKLTLQLLETRDGIFTGMGLRFKMAWRKQADFK